MIQETLLRLKGFEIGSPIISCGESHRFMVAQQIGEILPEVIADVSAFQKAVLVAASNAEQGFLVTFGIVPTFPATSYGYVKAAGTEKNGVLEFTEISHQRVRTISWTFIILYHL